VILASPSRRRVRLPAMARVVVDVMPKPEILDPQGKAVTGALARLGFAGMSVRQGKRFEIEVEGEVTEDRLEDVRRAAETLLANTVIETFDVRVEVPPESPDEDEPDDEIEPADQSDQDESNEQAELAATQAG
jgi:phosphoribosylformylglycinamidine synthase PurS subunit